jgi:pyruvate kinase
MPKRPIKKRSPVSPLKSATRIVSTLGPATTSERVLRAMMKAGVDVFRFNMSHGDHAFHAELMARVRKVADQLDHPIGILLDLQGPKVRTQRNVDGEPITLKRNETITITFGKGTTGPGHVVVDFPGIAKDLHAGDRLLFDDGKLIVDVTRASKGRVHATVVRGGPLKERAGVNVPGRALNVVIPTVKDRRDVKFAVAQEVDFLALSFVQSGTDIQRLKKLLARQLKKDQRAPAIVAKIEKPSALEHLDAILREADGVMVARGDLGVELSLEKVPVWQKEILIQARLRGRFSITATQMLESMIHSPSPTRAEVSDVANAILDGTDAVMLSAETAVGDYPVESVKILTSIADEVDDDFHRYGPLPLEPDTVLAGYDLGVEAVVRAGVEMAERSNARWIVIFTLYGRTVGLTTRYHPKVGVIAFTPHERTRRRLAIRWNTRSMLLQSVRDTRGLMRSAVEELRRNRLVKNGDSIVMMAGDAGMEEASNLLRLVKIEKDR